MSVNAETYLGTYQRPMMERYAVGKMFTTGLIKSFYKIEPLTKSTANAFSENFENFTYYQEYFWGPGFQDVCFKLKIWDKLWDFSLSILVWTIET